MAEEEEKPTEEKLEVSPEGEAMDNITLDQARVLALQHAQATAGFYGARFPRHDFVWEVVSQEDRDYYYDIRLSFQPAGRFRGKPGVERFIVDRRGKIEVRLVLVEPSGLSQRATLIRPSRQVAGLTFIVIAGAGLAVAFLTGALDADPRPSAPTPLPSSSPVPPATTAPAASTTTPTVIPVLVPTVAIPPTPTAVPTTVPPTPTLTPAPAPIASPTILPPSTVPTPTAAPTLGPPPTLAPTPTPTTGPTPTATPPMPTPTPAPSIRLSAASSARASSVAVAVEGFTPSGTATVKYAGSIVASSKADRVGAIDTLFTVPLSAKPGATHAVEAIDDATGRTVSINHQVPPPSLSLEPNQGFPGGPFTITGQGFLPSTTVRPIVFFGLDISTYPYAVTDSSGAFVVTLAVPKVISRDHTVTATAARDVARASYEVLPATVELTPSVGPQNTSVIVEGWGFPASSEIESLSVGGLDLLADATNLRAAPGFMTTVWGTFIIEVTVPELDSGVAEVTAEIAGIRAGAHLTVPPLLVSITPVESAIFGPVIITGSGFPVAATVTTVTINGIRVLGSHSPKTDADGAFEVTVVVPAISPGLTQVSVTVGDISFSSDFTVIP